MLCPGKAPTAEQRKLYDIAQEQILTNIELIKPGLSFKEFGEKCWPVPDEYVPNRYMMMIHGAGMVDEYPTVAYAADYADWGYDGEFMEEHGRVRRELHRRGRRQPGRQARAASADHPHRRRADVERSDDRRPYGPVMRPSTTGPTGELAVT